MRVYGSIQTRFWTHPEIRNLSDQAKLLAAYLLSSPHTNMLGCFRIPIGYIAEDLNWEVDLVRKVLEEITATEFLTYDIQHGWVFITNFLKYNPIENPNQAKSISKLFTELPQKLIFFQQLADKLLEHSEYFQEEFVNHLETLSEPFRNQEQDQDQEQNQKQDVIISGKPDVDPLKTSFFKKNKEQQSSLKAQAIEVLQFLNEKTGRTYRPVEPNLKLIMARIDSGATVMDCRQIIAKKTREWKGDAKMNEFLRPATLFNASKFEQYIGELCVPEEERNDDQ